MEPFSKFRVGDRHFRKCNDTAEFKKPEIFSVSAIEDVGTFIPASENMLPPYVARTEKVPELILPQVTPGWKK